MDNNALASNAVQNANIAAGAGICKNPNWLLQKRKKKKKKLLVWSGFDGCSEERGTGVQTQSFTASVLADHGGEECSNVDGETSTQLCNTDPCPIDCVLAQDPKYVKPPLVDSPLTAQTTFTTGGVSE